MINFFFLLFFVSSSQCMTIGQERCDNEKNAKKCEHICSCCPNAAKEAGFNGLWMARLICGSCNEYESKYCKCICCCPCYALKAICCTFKGCIKDLLNCFQKINCNKKKLTIQPLAGLDFKKKELKTEGLKTKEIVPNIGSMNTEIMSFKSDQD